MNAMNVGLIGCGNISRAYLNNGKVFKQMAIKACADARPEAAAACAAEFGLKAFRTVYPIDDMFAKAFAACQTDALPGETNAVPVVERNTDDLIADFLALNVPSLSKDKAKALVDAGATVELLAEKIDVNALAAKSQLPANLIRSTIEAAKGRVALDAPRGAPSAPSDMRPTSIKMGSAITE